MSVAITFVDGEAYPADLFHAWSGLIGGRYARQWRAWLDGATLRVISFRHGGSGADPRAFVAALAGAQWAEANLGNGDVTADDVAAAFVTAAATLGSTWVQAGAQVSRAGASDPGVEPTAWADRGDVRIHGARRDYGTLDSSSDNGGINGTVGGHTASPGPTYRAIAIIGRGTGGAASRLWAASGPAYAQNPGAMSVLVQEVVTLAGNVATIAPIAAAVAIPDDDVWLGMRAADPTNLRFRWAGNNPLGAGDYGPLEEIFRDAAVSDPATALPGSYDPSNAGGNFGLYPQVALVLEAAPYWADGRITRLVVGFHGDHDGGAGTPVQTLPADMAHETVSLRHEAPPWAAMLVAIEVAIAAWAPGEDMGGAVYLWTDLDFPASSPPTLLADIGPLGVAGAGWHHVDIEPPIETDGGELLGLALVCGLLTGGPATTLSLVYDEDVGNTETYPTAWLDGVERLDFTIHQGGLGSVAEYTTRDDESPPSPNVVADPEVVWPATLAITSSDRRPRNLPRYRYEYAHRDGIVVQYASSSGAAGSAAPRRHRRRAA